MALSQERIGPWLGCVAAIVLALPGLGSAEEPSDAASSVAHPPAGATRFDDAGRLYFTLDTGLHFTLDRKFAGDVDIDPPSGVDWDLGGGVGYNIDRHWGVELEFLGSDPDLRSATRGVIREISVLTIVPAVRYRWSLDDGRLKPYLSGGVGLSSVDTHDMARPYAVATTDSTTVAGSLASGFDYFLSENIAAGLELRYLIHPDQSAEVVYQNPRGGRAHYVDSLNLTSVSLLAHLRFFPGQQATADGEDRHLFLADHGLFDTDERRVYLSGLFGYYILFNKGAGAGVRLRDKGGDANLTKGGALGVNLDRNWGAEVQLLETPLNLRMATGPRFAKLDLFEVVPTLRYRWPLLEGRLVPFVTAGIGVSYAIGNDQRPEIEFQQGKGQVVVYPRYDVSSPSVVGTVGAGVEYFLNHHLSAGLVAPFHFYPDLDSVLRREGHTTLHGSVNFSGALVLLQLKAYLP